MNAKPTTHENRPCTATRNSMPTETQKPASHRQTIHSRIASLNARIRSTKSPRSVAVLVRTMTAHRDPEAIPALVALLDLPDDRVGSIERALVRYGEHAEDSLKAHALANAGPARMTACTLLYRIAYRARLRQLGCF